MQSAMTTNDTFVTYDYEDLKDGEKTTYQLPSYVSLLNRLAALETTIHNLAKGKGSMTLDDGTKRSIQLQNLP